MTVINTSIKPFLTVNNAAKAVDFYVSALGAIEVARYEMPNKKLTSKISVEDAEFWVGDEEPEFGNLSPGEHSINSVRIILQTNNADELFESAVKFGATEICPMTTEDAWRIGKLRDPFGHIWEIGYTL